MSPPSPISTRTCGSVFPSLFVPIRCIWARTQHQRHDGNARQSPEKHGCGSTAPSYPSWWEHPLLHLQRRGPCQALGKGLTPAPGVALAWRVRWAPLLHDLPLLFPALGVPCPWTQTSLLGQGRELERGSYSIPESARPGMVPRGAAAPPGAPVTCRRLAEPHVAARLLHAPRPVPKLAFVCLPQICFISLGA